jgi:hypothetical protein
MGTEQRTVEHAPGELDLQEMYPELTQDELAHLPILRPGTTLEAGGVYFDLNAPERGPFKALVGQQAGSGNRYVAQRDLDPDIWRRIVEQYSGTELEPESETPSAPGSAV